MEEILNLNSSLPFIGLNSTEIHKDIREIRSYPQKLNKKKKKKDCEVDVTDSDSSVKSEDVIDSIYPVQPRKTIKIQPGSNGFMKYTDPTLSYSNNNIDDGLWYLDDIRKFKKDLYENELVREEYEQTSKSFEKSFESEKEEFLNLKQSQTNYLKIQQGLLARSMSLHTAYSRQNAMVYRIYQTLQKQRVLNELITNEYQKANTDVSAITSNNYDDNHKKLLVSNNKTKKDIIIETSKPSPFLQVHVGNRNIQVLLYIGQEIETPIGKGIITKIFSLENKIVFQLSFGLLYAHVARVISWFIMSVNVSDKSIKPSQSMSTTVENDACDDYNTKNDDNTVFKYNSDTMLPDTASIQALHHYYHNQLQNSITLSRQNRLDIQELLKHHYKDNNNITNANTTIDNQETLLQEGSNNVINDDIGGEVFTDRDDHSEDDSDIAEQPQHQVEVEDILPSKDTTAVPGSYLEEQDKMDIDPIITSLDKHNSIHTTSTATTNVSTSTKPSTTTTAKQHQQQATFEDQTDVYSIKDHKPLFPLPMSSLLATTTTTTTKKNSSTRNKIKKSLEDTLYDQYSKVLLDTLPLAFAPTVALPYLIDELTTLNTSQIYNKSNQYHIEYEMNALQSYSHSNHNNSNTYNNSNNTIDLFHNQCSNNSNATTNCNNNNNNIPQVDYLHRINGSLAWDGDVELLRNSLSEIGNQICATENDYLYQINMIDKIRRESIRLTSLTATKRLNMFTRRIAHRNNLGEHGINIPTIPLVNSSVKNMKSHSISTTTTTRGQNNLSHAQQLQLTINNSNNINSSSTSTIIANPNKNTPQSNNHHHNIGTILPIATNNNNDTITTSSINNPTTNHIINLSNINQSIKNATNESSTIRTSSRSTRGMSNSQDTNISEEKGLTNSNIPSLKNSHILNSKIDNKRKPSTRNKNIDDHHSTEEDNNMNEDINKSSQNIVVNQKVKKRKYF